MTPLAATEAERLAFETEMRKTWGAEHFERVAGFEGECYSSKSMNGAWRGWQAARALQQTAEPVAIVGGGFQLLYCRQDWAAGLNVGDHLYTHAAPDRAPSTDSAADDLDSKRLKWMIEEEAMVENLTLQGTRYRVRWPNCGSAMVDWHASPRAAIDAAIAASLPPTK